MAVFQRLDDYGYGRLHLVHDRDVQLRAIVAIHSTQLGPALGGCRFVPYPSDDEAITDVLRLGQAMTYKAALAGLPHGGGKAVVMRPARAFDREQLFERLGRFVDSLGGQYIATEDSGVGEDDIACMRRQTRHAAGLAVAEGGGGDPSPWTALGVRRGIEACVAFALGRPKLEGLHVAVAGVGHVGYALCRELAGAGARLTVADIDTSAAQRVASEFGAAIAGPAEIHGVACDVYAPCALGGAINVATIPELNCRVVAGAANNQLAEAACGASLMQRGLVYAPDFAINAGGLINVADEVAGYDEARVRARTMAIYDTITAILERARQQQQPPHEVAEAMVVERLKVT